MHVQNDLTAQFTRNNEVAATETDTSSVVTTLDSLESISAKWDSILPANHNLRSENLLALQESKPADADFRYVLVTKKNSSGNESIVAVFYFQLMRFNTKHYHTDFRNNALFRFLEKIFMKQGLRILACGNLFRIEAPGIYWSEADVRPDEISRLLESCIGQLNFRPHAILLKDLPSSLNPAVKSRYVPWPGDLTMKLFLKPSWKSFDNYVSSFRHKYAQRARKARKKLGPIERIY